MVNTNKRVTTGRKSLFMFSFAALVVMATAVFLFWPSINDQARVAARVQSDESGRAAEIFSQVVRLDDAAGYAVYGGKGVDATGTSFRGAVGGGEGADLKGVDSAARGRSDIDAEVRKDLSAAYSAMRQLPCTTIEDGTLNDKTLGGGFYCVSGNTLERGLVFDAKGNAGAIFVVRVDGNFEARGGISLINGASQHNVYFAVDGDVMIGAGAEINGNIISRGNIDAAEGSSVKGRTISIDGTVNARQAELGGGTGVIEICKFIETGTSLPAQNFTFTFPAVGGGTQSVSIPAGVCSGPREVVAGTVVITETYNGSFAISRATASRVGSVPVATMVNIPAGTVSVNVLEGDLNNETTVNVFNQPVRGGFIEICKFPSPITAPSATPVATPTPTSTPTPTPGGPATFAGTGVGSIPDNNTTGLTVSFPVTGVTAPITTISLSITSTHTFIGDLEVTLRAPGGAPAHVIFDDVPDSSNLGGTYVFNDAASGNLRTAAGMVGDNENVPPGSYRTSNSAGVVTNFTAAFAGLTTAQANGTWTLLVRDLAALDSGAVSAASLTLGPATGPRAPDAAAPEVVGGIFEFTFLTFPGGATASVFVPVGSCSLPQQVTSFTAGTTTPSFPVTITEVGRPAILLESVTAVGGSPLTDRLVSVGGNIGIIGGGGTATVTVFAANAGNQTIVSFFNREAPGEIKVCKIAGPGVLVGTNFTFDVAGTVPGGTLTAPTFPGSLASFPVTVPAGPGPEGFCRFVRNAADTANQTFVVGRRVTIVERSVAGQTSPIVTRIDELNAGAPIVENLPARSVSFEVLLGTAVITYTNSSFTPGSLKVCKTGLGAAANVPSFTFDLSPTAAQAQFFEPGTNFGSVTVATNSCSPPILTLNADVDLLVDERPIGGTANTGTICQPGTCSIISTNTALGQANINLNTGITVNEVIFTNNTAAPAVAAPDFDFDGDGKSDPSIFRSTTGTWWVKGSTAGATATAFGSNGDIIAPADFDGDAKTDYAVYRAGTWHVLGSTAGYSATAFGLSGDIPQAGDYDGDRRADLAVYRPSNGTWYMLGSQVGFRAVNFGIATDLPTAADYDGDGRFDPAVYRDGAWYILGSTDGFRAFMFGVASDRPVQGDYDADGKADAAVYRNGTWHILRSTAGYAAYAFGMATDKPVPADYDGDRRADMAVYRPSNGVWHIMRSSVTESSAAYTSFAFGMETDTPVPY